MTELFASATVGLAELDYRSILDAIGEGFVLLDRQFTILDINAEGLRLNRRNREDLLGRTHWDVWPESLGTPIESAYHKVMRERIAVSLKYPLTVKQRVFWLDIRAYPVQDGMAVFFRDVTQAEQALQALQESEARFRAAVAATGVLWTNNAEGRMTDEQPGWSGLTGQSRAEYEGFGWAAALHPDDVEATIIAWHAAVAARHTFENEHRVRRHDGLWRTFAVRAVPVIDADGAVREWVGVHTDITERRQFEQALAIKEARVHLATDVAGVGIWTWNPGTDAVTWENERIYKIFGLANDAQPVNATVFAEQFLHPDDVPSYQAAVQNTLSNAERFYFQGRIYRADDRALRWVELHGELYQVDPGAFGILGTVADITVRKKGEEILQSTADALAQADRHKSEFIVTLAHELRNPLAPIRNGLQVLRMATDNPATVARVTAVMERQVGQMVHLIDDLLDIARISRGQIELRRELIDLKQIAAVAVETSLPLIEASHHDLCVEIGEAPLMLLADPCRIAQLISNLLNNAAKYTPAHGRIHLSAVRDDDMVDITVRDTGIGIPAANLAGIFGMFTQVGEHRPHAQGGLGIGLALVRTLVQLHGGTVEASSDGPGTGSRFVVRLPLAPVPTSQVE